MAHFRFVEHVSEMMESCKGSSFSRIRATFNSKDIGLLLRRSEVNSPLVHMFYSNRLFCHLKRDARMVCFRLLLVLKDRLHLHIHLSLSVAKLSSVYRIYICRHLVSVYKIFMRECSKGVYGHVTGFPAWNLLGIR